jgi:hypothetical protein
MDVKQCFPSQYEFEVLNEIPWGNVRRFYFPGVQTEGGQDGLMVKITPPGNQSWIGVFAFGRIAPKAKNGVYTCPNDMQICVVSRGEGYIVRTDNPNCFEVVKARPISEVHIIIERKLIVFADSWQLCAYGEEGLVWQTDRLAWDGLKITEVTTDYIRGEVDPWTDEKREFIVDIKTGRHRGGSV